MEYRVEFLVESLKKFLEVLLQLRNRFQKSDSGNFLLTNGVTSFYFYLINLESICYIPKLYDCFIAYNTPIVLTISLPPVSSV